MHWSWFSLLVVGVFTLATALDPAFRQWSARKAPAQSVLDAVLGDSRRLFANHFYIQSDVYLHGGYYPTIFDQVEKAPAARDEHDGHSGGDKVEAHEAEAAGHVHSEICGHDFLGKPRNWIDAFGRNFFPSKHTHLGEGAGQAVQAREILPWMKLAAELNPQQADSYTVAAFWLRQMNKNEEALQFLRQGWQANPNNYEILFELGLCYEVKKESERARNLWELALRRWQEQQADAKEPDNLLGAQILGHLARVEAQANRREQTIRYLEMLKKVSPRPDQVQQRIDEFKAGRSFEAEPKR